MGQRLEQLQQEFDVAIATFESWRPAAYDADLRARMGVSFATNTFNVVRGALWRETVLALGRIWDRAGRSVDLGAFRAQLQQPGFMDALMAYRAKRSAAPYIDAMIREQLSGKAEQVVTAIAHFERGGEGASLMDRLRKARNALAHRALEAVPAEGPKLEDAELVELFERTAKILGDLWSLIRATAYDPMEAAGVWAHYARHFWAAAPESGQQ